MMAVTCSHLLNPLLFSFLLLSPRAFTAGVTDTFGKGQNVTDGETLVSAGGSFTLGFFSPGVSTKRYLGIWFSMSEDVICWVANRDRPLTDGRGVLVISGTGSLLLLDSSGQVVWSSNTTGATASTTAQLRDSGNLVVSDGSRGSAVMWQSFDHLSNTMLPGMKIGKNLRTGAEWRLTSWRSANDPSPGNFRYTTDPEGVPQNVLLDDDGKVIYRSGPWNGLRFSGVTEMTTYSDMFAYRLTSTPSEITYGYVAKAGVPFSHLILTDDGVFRRLVWDPSSRAWKIFFQAPRGICDHYGKCGAFGLCNANAPSTSFCGCVRGFSPASLSQWKMRDTSGGCRRNVMLDCTSGNGTSTTDGFVAIHGVKLPDTRNASVDGSITLKECRARCLADCSCLAYAPLDIRGGGAGTGCVIWKEELMDLRYVDGGQTLYLRSAKVELGEVQYLSFPTALVIGASIASLVVVLFVLSLITILIKRRRHGPRISGMRRNKDIQKKTVLGNLSASDELDGNIELPFVSFRDIVTATDDFCNDNILGQGGFGKVYKGMLDDDKEVAIKRLGKGSRQGVEEFRNEVVLIAKLQHRNLVRLLGCCIDGDERLLIYEYLRNKSLDAFIFDVASKYVLDWPTRSKIIKGVARGLLYLHQDSRLTIIHRDLKASNILLDVDMSPKISDFGMARIFGRNQQEANTNRVVGTYGYMSPEYAMDGAFSVKSDTYSFGVILLEIISGLKISLPRLTEFPNLLAYAWSLWKDGKAMDMVDPSIIESCSPTEVLRCVHIGLLCVQDNPSNRPLMSTVVFMLENETTSLSTPKQPVYFAQRSSEAKEPGENTSSSMNNMTLTVLEGR